VPQGELDLANINSTLQESGRVAVSQNVRLIGTWRLSSASFKTSARSA
jgi:hypothetical protein